MFEIIFLVAILLYFLQILIFSIGASKRFSKIEIGNLPTATVIVAARNEEDNILRCIESLDKLEYPEGKLEIILVNDKSTDDTEKIIREFIKDKVRFKLINTNNGIGSLKGKANAIAHAIRKSSGEIILTTDADCAVSPKWAVTTASYYQKDVAMVCGYTDQKGEDAFSGMQSIDFIYLLTVASGAMNFGKPLSAIGNNMSYRRSVYNEVGGYENLEFSVTEDFNLLMAMHKLKRYKIIYPIDKDSLVTSKPCHDLKSLYWQKKRWSVGGLKSDIAGFSVMTVAFLAQLCTLLTIAFLSKVTFYLAFFKVVLDFIFVQQIFSKLKIKFNFKSFLVFQIYYISYVLIMPPLVFFNRKVKWKGREF